MTQANMKMRSGLRCAWIAIKSFDPFLCFAGENLVPESALQDEATSAAPGEQHADVGAQGRRQGARQGRSDRLQQGRTRATHYLPFHTHARLPPLLAVPSLPRRVKTSQRRAVFNLFVRT